MSRAINMRDIKIVEEGYKNAGSLVNMVPGHDIAYDDLARVLDARGLGLLKPKRTSEETALRRALEACKMAHTIKASIGKGRWTVHLRWKVAGAERVEHRQTMVAKIVNGEMVLSFSGDHDATREKLIREHYNMFLDQLATEDLTRWFRELVPKALDGVKTPLGWYVPYNKTLILNQIQAAVADIPGYRVARAPVSHSKDFIREALDGMEQEAGEAIKAIEKLLAEQPQDAEKLQERHLKVRRARAEILEEVKRKLARYEELFGEPIKGLSYKLMDLKMRLASTFFRSEAAERGQDVGEGARLLELDDRTGADATPEWTSERGRMLEMDDDHPSAEEADIEAVPERKLDMDDE